MPKQSHIDEIAKQVLIDGDNPAVMWGDVHILDEIASRTKSEKLNNAHPLERHKRILNALEKSKLFRKTVVDLKPGCRGNRYCRAFWLREELFI